MAQAILVSTDQSVFAITDVTTSGNISTDPVSYWEFEPLDWSWYTCLLFITAALGILGNSLVLVVTSSPRDAMRNPDLLIRALAIADLVTSVLIIPLPKAQVLPQNTAAQVYCKTVFSKLLIWISIIASIFTLTVLSVDRCVAIVHPFFYRRAVTRYRVKIVVVFVWIIALLINTDLLFVRYVADDNECVFSFPSHLSEDIYGGLRFLVEFLLPAVIMLLTHVATARALNAELARFREQTQLGAKLIIAKKRNVTSLLIVVLTFIICWGPNQFGFLLFSFGLLDGFYFSSVFHQITIILAFCNSCANPLIYTMRFPMFRTAVKNMLCKCSTSHPVRPGTT